MKGLKFFAGLSLCLMITLPVMGSPCNVYKTTVLKEVFSPIEEQYGIIDNEAEWCAFWDELFSTTSPPPECDVTSIDFNTEVAVVAAIGDRGNTCFDGNITCIQRPGTTSNIRIEVTETWPSHSRPTKCGQMVVYPVHVVKIYRPVGRATFTKKIVILE